VIGADGSQVGILPTHEAMRLAEEQGLELVEVNPRAAPPVCKIMDFGKFKYETSKKEKASRKHQSTILLKEIKLRPKTDDHDLDFKVKHIRRFLSEGNKCKLVTVFRGREIVHPETGQAMLDQVMKMVADIATVEQRAIMEGRRMVMVIGPKAGVVRSANVAGAPIPSAGAAPRPPGLDGVAAGGAPPRPVPAVSAPPSPASKAPLASPATGPGKAPAAPATAAAQPGAKAPATASGSPPAKAPATAGAKG
jgi:translation initiation factor IF-3